MIDEITKLRILLDGYGQLCKELCRPNDPLRNAEWIIYATREVEKTVNSIYLAKAWLGKMLKELGSSTPYPNDGNRKTVDDIEPTADRNFRRENVTFGYLQRIGAAKEDPNIKDLDLIETYKYGENKAIAWGLLNHIEKVDFLRQRIEDISTELSKMYSHTPAPSREFSIARTNAYTHCCEARFWLGFELERIRLSEK